jgi:hypothetical protein
MIGIFLSCALEALMSVYFDPKVNFVAKTGWVGVLLLVSAVTTNGTAIAQEGSAQQNVGVFVVPPDRIIQGTINGQPVRYEFTGSLPTYSIIDPQVAKRLGLKAQFLPVFGRSVNTGKLNLGKTAKVNYSVGTQSGYRSITWYSRPDSQSGDISLSLSSIEEPVVTYMLRPQQNSERLFAMPLKYFSENIPGTTVQDSKNKIFIIFDFRQESNVANASMAINLVAENGGGFITDQGRILTTIRTERPARTLKLGRPLLVGPLQLSLIDVLTNARGNAKPIPNANVKIAPAREDEIVVVANRKVKRGNEDAQFLSIGTQALSACSSITFDRKLKEIRMSCVAAE